MTQKIKWIEPFPYDDGDTKELWLIPPQTALMFHPVSHKRERVQRGCTKHTVMLSNGWIELEAGQRQS